MAVKQVKRKTMHSTRHPGKKGAPKRGHRSKERAAGAVNGATVKHRAAKKIVTKAKLTQMKGTKRKSDTNDDAVEKHKKAKMIPVDIRYVESFRKKLESGLLAMDAIRHFNQMTHDNRDHVLGYLRAGGTMKPLLKILTLCENDKYTDIADLFILLHYTLKQSINYDETHKKYATKYASKIFTNYQTIIMNLLRKHANPHYCVAGFRILEAILLVDPVTYGKDILKLMDVCLQDMDMMQCQEVKSDETLAHDSLRTAFIDFNLTFLIDTRYDLVRRWLTRTQLLQPLLHNLVHDEHENVVRVMEAFSKYVVSCVGIDKYIYRTTFNIDILKALVNVYEWQGPKKDDASHEQKQSVYDAAEPVLMPLLTSKKCHLVPKTIDLARSSSRHKHVLLGLKSSQLHEYQQRLVLRMFEVCPTVLPIIMDNYGTLLKKPQNPYRKFILNILSLLKPEEVVRQFTNADAKYVANFVVKTALPRTVLEFVGIALESELDQRIAYSLRYLAVMIGQCEKYIREIEKLTNFDQFAQKRIKFEVINQMLALFPSADSIIAAIKTCQKSKRIKNLYSTMEDAMDILLVCIRTFPSYIQSTAFLATYLIFLNPIAHHKKPINSDRSRYALKAIQVVMALEPQSVAFDSQIFPSVLKLVTKMYLSGEAEMQRDASRLLLSVFGNTVLFGNNSTEIEIWFDALRPLMEHERLEIIETLCKCFREASKQLQSNTAQDHSFIDAVFENERKDFTALLEQIEKEDTEEASENEGLFAMPITNGFFTHMIRNIIPKSTGFECYYHGVALRYFYYLPYPEIAEKGLSHTNSALAIYMRRWLDGSMTQLKAEFECFSRLSAALVKPQRNWEEVLNGVVLSRCDLVYLTHEIIFYVTRSISCGKLSQALVDAALFYFEKLCDLLLDAERDLDEADKKLPELMRNIFCQRSVLYQNFSIIERKNETSKLVTGFVYELMKKLRLEPNFSHFTALYSKKIVNELISTSASARTKVTLNTQLMEKLLEIFELTERNCAVLVQHYSNLPYRHFIDKSNEKTYHFNLLCASLVKLSQRDHDHFLTEPVVHGISKIYIDFIRKIEAELNLDSFESALLSYLASFSHNIAHLDGDIFRTFFETKRIGKPTTRLAVFLLQRDDRFRDAFLELLPGNVTKKELVYPLLNVAFEKRILMANTDEDKKLLTLIYGEYKSGLSKTIDKPQKAAVIYKENPVANQHLIRFSMPKNECIDFAKKKQKLDAIEVYQLNLMMEIYRNALQAAQEDAALQKQIYVNVFAVLLQFYGLLLKSEDILKDVDKLNELVLATHAWCQLSKRHSALAEVDFKDLTDSSNWKNFCKNSLRLGIDLVKSTIKVHRYDSQLHVLPKIMAVMIDRFYQDNSAPPDIATFYELALSHSRFLDVLLVQHEFNVKTSLVLLLYTMAKKNHTVMDKKHIPLLLGAYGATVSDGNRYILALMQLYERSGVHIHEYRPFLWGEAAIKHFSLGENSTEQQFYRTNNVEVIWQLNKTQVNYTIQNFPLWRKLDACDHLPELNFDELQTNGSGRRLYRSFWSPVQQFVEERLGKSKPTDEMLVTCSAKNDFHATTIYDPAFLLPMLGYLFSPESTDLLLPASKSGVLAVPFLCLSSNDEKMRLAAATVIIRIRGFLELSRKCIDNQFWIYLFSSVQAGLQQINSKSTASIQMPPFIPSLFVAETIQVLPNVLNELHGAITGYILRNKCFNFKAIPNFLEMFHSSTVEHNAHRRFMLEIICNGIKTHQDFLILRCSPVLRALMEFYASPLSNRELNGIILTALNSLALIPRSCEVMINALGFLTWLSERIEVIESFHFDTIETFLTIISNCWYSAKLVSHKRNYLHQLSHSVLIMALKFVPLLSTRSSSETLLRLMDLLEKTTQAWNVNLTLISEETVTMLMEHFELIFGDSMWCVKYIRKNGVRNHESCAVLSQKLAKMEIGPSAVEIILSLRRFIILWESNRALET